MRTKLELLDLTAKQFVILDSLCFRVKVRLKSSLYFSHH